MCGRYTLRAPLDALAVQFEAIPAPGLQLDLRYNIAPTQPVPVVRIHDVHRQIIKMHWGLIPSWSKEPKASYSTMNARADTLATKPAFRSAFKSRRCLVLADGYYEWKAEGTRHPPSGSKGIDSKTKVTYSKLD
jgi:putative SOS response-associated peptidase YedK